MKRPLHCLLGTRLCVRPPCQLPEAPSLSVWGGLGVWSLGLGCGTQDLVGSVWGQSIFQRPHCLQVGQGLTGGRGVGQDLAQCPVWLHLKQEPGGLHPIQVGLMGQRGWIFSWVAAVNKAYLGFFPLSFFFFRFFLPIVENFKGYF